MAEDFGIIKASRQCASNTLPALTKSPVSEVIMAKESLPYVCRFCNSPFESKNTNKVFCSKSCASKSIDGSYKLKHGEAARKDKPASREYAAYMSAKSRCTNACNRDYDRYGKRGIQFRFTSFEQFLNAVGRKPSKPRTRR